MANQRKSYRNVLATAAGAAVVATAVAPGAVAADDHTAADAFPDVAEGMTHYEAINALYQDEIILGYEDGNYHPYESLTRIQAALMIERAKGLESDGDIDYDYEDVPGGYEETVDAVTDAGYFEGSVDGDFDPYEELTREQMAKVLVEAYDLPVGEDVPESDFTDRDETALMQEYIDAVANAGVAEGFPEGDFGVGEEIKRLDFAAMLYKAMNWEADEEITVESLDGTVAEVLTGIYAVELDLSDYANADSTVQISVGDETIDLEYDAEEGTFKNRQISGFDQEELLGANVWVDGEMLPIDGNQDPVELGTVMENDGTVAQVLTGIYAVKVDLSDSDEVTADSTVSLMVGDEMVELEYDEEDGTYKNRQISGFAQADLEGATIVVE